MENPNSKDQSNNNSASAEQNPSNDNGNGNNIASQTNGGDNAANRRRRTPFTDLSQEDADLALARTLQEQERAYMMLRMNAGGGGYFGEWEEYGYEDEIDDEDDDYDDASEEDYDGSDAEVEDAEAEDAFDANADDHQVADGDHNSEVDLSAISSDEAYARALQDAEEREMAARLMALAGISEMVVGDEEEEEDENEDGDEDEDEVEDEDDDEEDIGGNSLDAWEEVDPDELSYEELIALGDVVGTESRGLSSDSIASLPSVKYKSAGGQEGIGDSCVICRLDYEDDETLTVLSCKHSYHTECINNWLKINKVCPVCSAEVSTSTKP